MCDEGERGGGNVSGECEAREEEGLIVGREREGSECGEITFYNTRFA